MEKDGKLFCKNCGNIVQYSRDSRQFCDDACKDRYYYSERRIKEKRARFIEQIKQDPKSYTMLDEEVLTKLSLVNDPILETIAKAEKDKKAIMEGLPKLRVKVGELEEDIKLLLKEQGDYLQFREQGKALKAWIEQEKTNLLDLNFALHSARFVAFKQQENQYRDWVDENGKKSSTYLEDQKQLATKTESLRLARANLNKWEKIEKQNNEWLSSTYLELNLKRVAYLKIVPLPRRAKRKEAATKKESPVSKPLKDSNPTGEDRQGWYSRSTGEHTSLGPPEREISKSEGMRFFLGMAPDGKPLYWHPLGQTNPHVLAIGKSGSGKTTFIGICLYEAGLHKLPLVAFDYDRGLLDKRLCNRDGIQLAELIGAKVIDASAGIGINPLALPEVLEREEAQNRKQSSYQDVAEGLSQSLAIIFELGEVQKGLLLEAIEEAYRQKGYSQDMHASDGLPAPSFKDVWRILQEKKDMKEYSHLLLRLKSFLSKNLFDSKNTIAIEELFRGNTFIDLSGMASDMGKAAITRLLLGKIYEHMLSLGPAKEDELRLLILIDEAHFLTKDVWVEKLITVARKFGVVLLLASHSGKDFSEKSFNTVGTKLALRLEGSDAKRMADNMGVVERKEKKLLEERILNQEKLHGVMRNDEHSPYTFFKLIPLYERD